ncbi:hypothetical protein BJ742DRAFT_805025 [Cladochytrium replicatum]|nr:hypothetical protein BJ742DRAFT_805025 [Cladochytrium replicatum]
MLLGLVSHSSLGAIRAHVARVSLPRLIQKQTTTSFHSVASTTSILRIAVRPLFAPTTSSSLQLRFRSSKKPMLSGPYAPRRRVKLPRSVRAKKEGRKYKLKSHRGAYRRWIVVKAGHFKRAQAGAQHLNRKMRRWKRVVKRRRVLSNPMQRRMLKKLLPYYNRRYMR